MKRIYLFAVVVMLAGCVVAPPEIAIVKKPGEAKQQAAPKNVSDLFEQYFLDSLELNPRSGTTLGMQKYNSRWVNFLGEQHLQKIHEFNRHWTERLATVNPALLDEQNNTSMEILAWRLELAIEGEQFPAHLMPINQFNNFANVFAHAGSGQAGQPFVTAEDYVNWRLRARGIPVVIDQAIENMRVGIAQGLVEPRVLMEKVLPQLSAQIVQQPEDSIFWRPVKNFPATFTEAERDRISITYRNMISDSIIPAYRRLHDFIRDEYLPECRESVGMADLPNGANWYQYKIKRHTTTTLGAAEIHEFGLQEVARILEEMKAVQHDVGFEGTLEQFFRFLETDEQFYWQNEQDLIAGYKVLQVKINKLLPKAFDIFPKTDYQVRAVEPFVARTSAGASYQRGAPDGSRAGVFYINTYNLKAQPKFGMETLSLHEASPGHHFQITIQQEIQNLPMFRAYGGFTVFSEGWALYAESLGKELGLFTDPYQYFGKLSDEMLRAMRLVVDTGLHAKGWTREQAIEYMLDNSTLAESDIIAEVERYIAIPAQALSYKIGQRIISGFRQQAQQALGDQFDIKEFHRLVLTGGSMPMATMTKRFNHWMDGELSR